MVHETGANYSLGEGGGAEDSKTHFGQQSQGEVNSQIFREFHNLREIVQEVMHEQGVLSNRLTDAITLLVDTNHKFDNAQRAYNELLDKVSVLPGVEITKKEFEKMQSDFRTSSARREAQSFPDPMRYPSVPDAPIISLENALSLGPSTRSKPQPEAFVMVLCKADASGCPHIGAEFGPGSDGRLVVKKISDSGLVTLYNKKVPPEKKLVVGDIIIDVNRKTDTKTMLRECQNKKLLRMTIIHDVHNDYVPPAPLSLAQDLYSSAVMYPDYSTSLANYQQQQQIASSNSCGEHEQSLYSTASLHGIGDYPTLYSLGTPATTASNTHVTTHTTSPPSGSSLECGTSTNTLFPDDIITPTNPFRHAYNHNNNNSNSNSSSGGGGASLAYNASTTMNHDQSASMALPHSHHLHSGTNHDDTYQGGSSSHTHTHLPYPTTLNWVTNTGNKGREGKGSQNNESTAHGQGHGHGNALSPPSPSPPPPPPPSASTSAADWVNGTTAAVRENGTPPTINNKHHELGGEESIGKAVVKKYNNNTKNNKIPGSFHTKEARKNGLLRKARNAGNRDGVNGVKDGSNLEAMERNSDEFKSTLEAGYYKNEDKTEKTVHCISLSEELPPSTSA